MANLGCGPIYVDSTEWLNLDFFASSKAIIQANLLNKLPLDSDSVSVVYSSHFLEHIPLSAVNGFLAECYRVLAPGGVIRLVLPDLENIANEYVSMRRSGDHEKANFLVYELIDQSVRNKSGGQMGKLYSELRKGGVNNHKTISNYIYERVGENIYKPPVVDSASTKVTLSKIRSRIEKYWIKTVVTLLPSGFRDQNISFAEPGERHLWLWDFFQLKNVLQEVGFQDIQKQSVDTSSILNFPFAPLDLDESGNSRKGKSSMYVEAVKPIC
jgi:predicted SAM-dependent methyltransferase